MGPRTPGRITALLIVVFWAAMTTKLLRQEVFLTRLDAGRMRVPSSLRTGGLDRYQEEWQGIYYEKTKVGYAHTTITRVSDRSYTIRSTAQIALRILERDMDVQFRGTAVVGNDGLPDQLFYDVSAGPANLNVTGRRTGDLLDLRVVSAGRIIHKAIPVTPSLTLSNAITPSLYWPELELGKTYTLDVLDPLALATQPAKIRARGREPLEFGGGVVETTVLEFEYNGLTFVTWLSDSGLVLRQESDLGWYLVREDEAVAKAGIARGAALGRALEDFASIVSFHTFRDSQAVTFLRARLAGVSLDGLALDGAQQRLLDPAGGIVEMTRGAPDPAAAPALPIAGAAFQPYLAAEPLIQSDDPAIVATARAVVGDETNSWLAARRLGDWVFATLEKDLLASVPSAVEILETKRGDCNEHTTLFTALARAVGIPTRFAVGVVYNDGRYYYHAWPEVYVGEWVPMDPTFGQPVADATHIRLLEGDLSQQSRLARVFGRLRIDVLADSEHAPPPGAAS